MLTLHELNMAFTDRAIKAKGEEAQLYCALAFLSGYIEDDISNREGYRERCCIMLNRLFKFY